MSDDAHDRQMRIVAPATGEAIELADVPDPVFSAGTMGEGLGIRPTTGTVQVLAPVDGTVVMVAGTGKLREVCAVPKGELGFVLASGAATCASWLCYYRALQDGPASVVVPIDKLSVLVTVLFSALVLREAIGRRYLVGLALLVGGTLAMLM